MIRKRKVLMSIKPEYVRQILSKKKLYEFRKSIFNQEEVEVVVIYASSPIQRIVAEFKINDITYDSPNSIWDRHKYHAGIDEESFKKYFFNKDKAFSIHISDLNIYDEPINPYDKIEGFRPPQSYMYFNTKLEKIYEDLDTKAS